MTAAPSQTSPPTAPGEPKAPTIERLAHVGIHVEDHDRAVAFYRDVLGLQVTDSEPELGMTFLSSRPDVEHHELLIAGGRTSPAGILMLQQISWRCSSLDDVIGYHHRLIEHGVALDMEVNHGNAIGVYFYDPEGNRNEVYWPTGLKARQVYLEGVDLEAPVAEILDKVRASVDAHGDTGYIEPGFLEKQQVAAS